MALLEAKLTELSITVGDYDRHRNSDQYSIQILKVSFLASSFLIIFYKYLTFYKDQIAELETRAHIVPYDFDSEKQDKSLKLSEQSNSRDDPQSDLHGN